MIPETVDIEDGMPSFQRFCDKLMNYIEKLSNATVERIIIRSSKLDWVGMEICLRRDELKYIIFLHPMTIFREELSFECDKAKRAFDYEQKKRTGYFPETRKEQL